ncbi:hypothetical protein AAC03nite_28310 [Alicyclobacillus acidoterrestris]|nr:hypothetical protein AAC03nite_28310 [Alicyclobacillus acidoterrestris]
MISVELYIDPRDVDDYLKGKEVRAWTSANGYSVNMKILVPAHDISVGFWGDSIYIKRNDEAEKALETS